jgi:hypothetical protein
MLQKIGFFHFANPDKSQPLASLKARLDERGKDDLKDSIVVLPEAFNLIGEYEPQEHYNVVPSVNVKHSLTQFAKQFDMVYVVGLIDNDEPDRPDSPYSSAYLITSTCCCRLSRKMGKDDLADCPHGQRIYQPFPQPSDTPSQVIQEACIAGLLCMDALTWPNPSDTWNDNKERHRSLNGLIQNKGSALPILCVPARMTNTATKNIEKTWPDVHFILANACPPGDSNTYPSVIRIKRRNPVMFPNDPSAQPDALILESF